MLSVVWLEGWGSPSRRGEMVVDRSKKNLGINIGIWRVDAVTRTASLPLQTESQSPTWLTLCDLFQYKTRSAG